MVVASGIKSVDNIFFVFFLKINILHIYNMKVIYYRRSYAKVAVRPYRPANERAMAKHAILPVSIIADLGMCRQRADLSTLPSARTDAVTSQQPLNLSIFCSNPRSYNDIFIVQFQNS